MAEVKRDQSSEILQGSPIRHSIVRSLRGRMGALATIAALGVSVIGCSPKKPANDPATMDVVRAELVALAAEIKAKEELAALVAEIKAKEEENPPPPPPQSDGLILSEPKPYFKPGEHSLKSIPMPSSAALGSEQNAGISNEPPGPTAGPSSLEVTNGTIANATNVVKNMRARFRGCYQTGLRSNPYMSGSVTLTTKIGPKGKVKAIDETGDGGLAPIIPCLKAVVNSGKFAPPTPTGSDATIAIPIRFVQQ